MDDTPNVQKRVYIVEYVLRTETDSILSSGKKVFSSQSNSRDFARRLDGARRTLDIPATYLQVKESTMTLDE